MRVRVLSEWSGSAPCGTVAEVPDALARERIRTGWAEPVTEAVVAPVASAPEAAIVAPVERAVKPRANARGGRP